MHLLYMSMIGYWRTAASINLLHSTIAPSLVPIPYPVYPFTVYRLHLSTPVYINVTIRTLGHASCSSLLSSRVADAVVDVWGAMCNARGHPLPGAWWISLLQRA